MEESTSIHWVMLFLYAGGTLLPQGFWQFEKSVQFCELTAFAMSKLSRYRIQKTINIILYNVCDVGPWQCPKIYIHSRISYLFYHSYYFTDNKTICGEFLSQSSGSLHSPDEDNDGEYENEMECHWTLTAPEHQVIYLKFLEFDIEYIINCDFDFVEVREAFTLFSTT